ncbi:MAG: hypothetical protein HDQ93_00650 [Desulfovibrio sp.]|nr:hypothetical protein [Desulfovibrio sp.]
MNLTIPLTPAAKIALETEASVKNKSLEQAAGDVIDTFFTLHGAHEDGYDAWYRAKVEEGLEEARQGKFVSNEEVERRAKARREWLLQQKANQQ